MKEITKAEFIDGYERGEIQDVVVVENKVYGRQSLETEYRVVFANL